MSDAQHRGWGNPDDAGYRQKNIVKIVAGGVTLYVRREVAHLFAGFCDELVARGYRLNGTADDWGYVNRDIRGRPGVKSNHAWGLAIDLNSTNNPMTGRHPDHAARPGHDGRGVHTDMPDWVGDVADAWSLYWGANYSKTPDAMHFEYLGTPAQVPRGRIGQPTIPTEEPDVNERQNQILENLEKRSAAQSEAIADMQQRLARIEEKPAASGNTGNASIAGKYTIDITNK